MKPNISINNYRQMFIRITACKVILCMLVMIISILLVLYFSTENLYLRYLIPACILLGGIAAWFLSKTKYIVYNMSGDIATIDQHYQFRKNRMRSSALNVNRNIILSARIEKKFCRHYLLIELKRDKKKKEFRYHLQGFTLKQRTELLDSLDDMGEA